MSTDDRPIPDAGSRPESEQIRALRALVEGSPGLIFYRFRLDPPALDYVSPSVERVLGVPPAAFHADLDLSARLADPEGVLRDSEAEVPAADALVSRWDLPGGGYVALEHHRVRVTDANGRPVAVEGVARDVTAAVERERTLRENGQQLEAVVGAAPVILWALDRDGRVTTVRGAGLAAFGVDREDIVGKPVSDVHPDLGRVVEHLGRALGGDRLALDVRVGDHVLATVAVPARDATGMIDGVIGVSTDVTAERRLEGRAHEDARRHASVRLALERLEPDHGLDLLAHAAASELTRLRGVERGSVLGFGPGGLVYVLATSGIVIPGLEAGRRLKAVRARYLRGRARQGPWVDTWEAGVVDEAYGLRFMAAGIRTVAYQPLRFGRVVLGLLALASRDQDPAAHLEPQTSFLAEVGGVVSAILGPAMRDRARAEHVRAEIERVIGQRRFHPVFQPMVSLDDGRVVAYEALTRFEDGTPPARRFAEASTVGLSLDLEVATLAAALNRARDLPTGLALTLNVSPGLLLEAGRLAAVLETRDRPVTLELTEHEPIDDYPALRSAMASIPDVRLSVDDAGAGYASLLHCVELRPETIKLDRSLVGGVDGDASRLAIIAGLRHFADAIGSELIAEGIETEAERAALSRIGVRVGQGYLFGRPEALGT